MQQSLAMLAARIVATIAALLHVVFFVFESVLWMRPAVSARFGIATREQAETIRPMAYNQGFYNLALAIGVLVGVGMAGADGSTGTTGRTLIIFGTACMAFAGVILASTGATYRRAAAIQFAPAAAALILTVLT